MNQLSLISAWDVFDAPVPRDADYATFDDIYENIGDEYEYIPSYIFKRITMTMMALDENKRKTWKEDDIPDLVITIFMIINDLILCINQATFVIDRSNFHKDEFYVVQRSELFHLNNVDDYEKDDSNVYNTIEVHLDRFLQCKVVDTNVSSEEQMSIPKAQGTTFPPFYDRLCKAITAGNCQDLRNLFLRSKYQLEHKRKTLDLGISNVIDLMKAVCNDETKTTSKFFIQLWENFNLDEKYISKSELFAGLH